MNLLRLDEEYFWWKPKETSGHTISGIVTGTSNVGMGYGSFTNLTSSSSNVAIGYNALLALTTGTPNTALGYDCDKALTTGYYCVTIGHDAQSTGAASGNQFTMGSANINNLRCNDTSIASLSDSRDKTKFEIFDNNTEL